MSDVFTNTVRRDLGRYYALLNMHGLRAATLCLNEDQAMEVLRLYRQRGPVSSYLQQLPHLSEACWFGAHHLIIVEDACDRVEVLVTHHGVEVTRALRMVGLAAR